MSAQAIKLAKNLAEIHALIPQLENKHLDAMSRFPHIIEKLNLVWGFKEGSEYLRSLTVDDRGGRQGFPADMLFTIHRLIELHDEKYPQYSTTSHLPFSC